MKKFVDASKIHRVVEFAFNSVGHESDHSVEFKESAIEIRFSKLSEHSLIELIRLVRKENSLTKIVYVTKKRKLAIAITILAGATLAKAKLETLTDSELSNLPVYSTPQTAQYVLFDNLYELSSS